MLIARTLKSFQAPLVNQPERDLSVAFQICIWVFYVFAYGMTFTAASATQPTTPSQNLANVQIEDRIPSQDTREKREPEDAISPTLPSGGPPISRSRSC